MTTDYVLSLICLWYAYKGVYDNPYCMCNLWHAQVKIWFQNRRTKWKKQHPGMDINSPSLPPITLPHHGLFPFAPPLPPSLLPPPPPPASLFGLYGPPPSGSLKVSPPTHSPLGHLRFHPYMPAIFWCELLLLVSRLFCNCIHYRPIYINEFWLSFCMWICCCTQISADST